MSGRSRWSWLPAPRLYLQLCAAEDASTPQHTHTNYPDTQEQRIMKHMENWP